MTRLEFLIARILRLEGRLQGLSCPPAEIEAQLAGRSVALIGNARKAAPPSQGAQIEAADLVIRLNRAPLPSVETHGSRTDILALATALSPADLARIRPGRILWLSPKRKRLPWLVAQSPGFHLPRLDDFERLRAELAAPPSTGLMMIDLIARSGAKSCTLYGFDFFASQSLSGRRTAAQVPHDFDAERRFVDRLLARDPRFALSGAA